MAQPNGAQAPLIRPQQVDALPHLSAENKQFYKNGLANLWHVVDTKDPNSQEYKEAHLKIKQATVKIMQHISNPKRPNSGDGSQQQRPPTQQGGQPGGAPQSSNMAAQGSQQGQQGGGGQPQQQQGQQGGGQQMSAAVRSELGAIRLNIPPTVAQQGEGAVASYKHKWYMQASQLLNTRDQIRIKGSQLKKQQQSGQGDMQQVNNDLNKCMSDIKGVMARWDKMKADNESNANLQAPGMQRQHSGGIPTQQQQIANAQQQQQNNQQQGDAKMQMDQGSAQSPQAPQGGFPQQNQQSQTQQPHGQVAPSPAPTQAQNMSQPPNSAHPQQTPQSATQPSQNFPQQNQMHPQQQHPNQQRPQINTQQMHNAQQNMMQQQQHVQTPGMQQSATQPQAPPQPPQQQQQRPQPLTHQAAMSQAAEQYSRQQQAQTQQAQPLQQHAQMPHVPNGLPMNPPHSATAQTPNSAYPTMPQQSQIGTTNKFPIQKNLQLDARTQQPVQGQPARPTYNNAGMMQQPGIQRPPQFTLEGEGDRVLSKRKLDELVRQVTGSVGSTSSANGTSSNALSADVEEAMLTYADNFVDNVITSACRLAKLRSNQTLDVRDVQMVLERNYGIRIPGYGLDEVRTVRKFQPAAGWTSKMQAVQAAKVTNKDS